MNKNYFETHLVLIVGQACNLRCVNCANFCPESLPEDKVYPVDEIIRSLGIVLKNVSKIPVLQIQGGEPFLYKELDVLIRYAEAQKKIESILIASNGECKPSIRVLEEIKRSVKTTVRISDYSLSDSPVKVRNILNENGVRNHYYEFFAANGAWVDCGGKDYEPVDDNMKEEHFKTCGFNICLTLEDGEIAYCSRATKSHKVQGFTRDEKDFVIVEDSEDFGKRLRDYVTNKSAMEACRYCNGTQYGKLIKPAIQM